MCQPFLGFLHRADCYPVRSYQSLPFPTASVQRATESSEQVCFCADSFQASANVIFLFYCIIQAVKMTLNNVQTAIKHQHLASEEIKMQQEEGAAAGVRNDGVLME